jgi:SSS family solute:Na+ symporter
LIEGVNIVGSLVYGTILGIFLTGFYLKKVGAIPVLIAGMLVQVSILCFYFFTDVPFLWYNVIGGLTVPILAWAIQPFMNNKVMAETQ